MKPNAPAGGLRFAPMHTGALDTIAAIDHAAYAFPWSRGNFVDALASGYLGRCAYDAHDALLGYTVLMPVVDEMHLLNLCVTPPAQRRGVGRALLDDALQVVSDLGLSALLLEVRPSNAPALALYAGFGFDIIGRRRNYYPAAGHGREDALVMRLALAAGQDIEQGKRDVAA